MVPLCHSKSNISIISLLHSLERHSLQDRKKAVRLTIFFKIRNNELCVTAAKEHLVPTVHSTILQDKLLKPELKSTETC